MGRLRNTLVRWLTRDQRYLQLPGGIRVPVQGANENAALTISAVWSAVTLLAGHLSSVPLNLYRRLPGGGREKATEHPVYRALHDEPYPGISAVDFREALVANIELHGVGYAIMTAPRDGLRLMAVDTLHVTPDPQLGVYRIEDGKRPGFTVPKDNMLVFPSLTLDAVNPAHVTANRRRSLSLAISYEERAEAFNRNSGIPSGIAIWGEGYSKMSEDDRKRLEGKWEQLYQGVANAGGTAFLPQGSEFKPVQFDPEALQMLASRQHSVTEVARWFRLPPHKLGDLSRATFSNIEHQAIEYIQDSLLPRARKIEATLTLALIRPAQRDTLFIEHNLDGLQRGDFKSRMEGYSIGRMNGWLSANDIRALENMNPIPEPEGGNTYLVPLNMIPSTQSGAIAQSRFSSSDNDHERLRTADNTITREAYLRCRAAATVRRNITTAYGPAFKRSAKAIITPEMDQVRVAANEHLPADLPGFLMFLDSFYADDGFTPKVRREMQAVIADYARQIEAAALEEIGSKPSPGGIDETIERYLDNYAVRHVVEHRNRLGARAREATADDERDAHAEVVAMADSWEESQPDDVARDEGIRAEGAFSRAAWAVAGVNKLVWVTFDRSCPSCMELDGRVISITESFVTKGAVVGIGTPAEITVNTNIGHPQLHGGCDCGVAAVIGIV